MRSSMVSIQDVSGVEIGGGLLDLVVDLVDGPVVGMKGRAFGFPLRGDHAQSDFLLSPARCGSDVPPGNLVIGMSNSPEQRRASVSCTRPPWGPMWCVKRLRVPVPMVVDRRGSRCGSWRAGSGCGGGLGRGRPGCGVSPAGVCTGSRPGRPRRSAASRRRTGTWRA